MRNYESVSSITTFLSCPYAYFLQYHQKVARKTNSKMELGSFIDKQIQLAFNDPEALIPESLSTAIDYLREYLDGEEIGLQREFTADIGGQNILIKPDIITQTKLIEIKATQSPDYYRKNISWQNRTYAAVLDKLGLDYQPEYLLIEIKVRQKNKTDYYEIVNVHSEPEPTTPLSKASTIKQLTTVCDFIKLCKERWCFPPSNNGCGRCLVKEHCEYYNGY